MTGPPEPPRAPSPLDDDWPLAALSEQSEDSQLKDPPTDELPLPVWTPEQPPEPAASVPVASRRTARPRPRAGPGKALVGAGLALAGVCLGIGALLWLDGGDDPSSAAARRSASSTTPQPSALSTKTAAASTPSALPVPAAPKPVVAKPVLPPAPPSTAAAAAARLPVVVLNNSRFAGLAARAAARFRAGGWSTPVVGNVRGRLARTTVYYGPGQVEPARRFARQFGIARVLPGVPGLPGHGLTVVLTRDFA